MDRELSARDVSALVPPARGQEGVKEIIPTRLTTNTEKRGSKTDTIRTPWWLDLVPPDTFSFAQSGDRRCWVLPSLQPGEKPRKTVLKLGGYFRWLGWEWCAKCAIPEEGKQSEGRLMLSWSAGARLSGSSNSQTAPLACAPRQKCRLGVLLLLPGRKRGNIGQVPAKYDSTSACFYITASSAFFFFFFYVDASCRENMEFLKGPRTRRAHVTVPCSSSSSPAVADRWLHLCLYNGHFQRLLCVKTDISESG